MRAAGPTHRETSSHLCSCRPKPVQIPVPSRFVHGAGPMRGESRDVLQPLVARFTSCCVVVGRLHLGASLSNVFFSFVWWRSFLQYARLYMAELPHLTYPTSPNGLLYSIVKHSNAFCSLFLPEAITARDRVYHHHTRTPQARDELWATLLIYYVSTFVCVTLLDFLFARPLTVVLMKLLKMPVDTIRDHKKVSWFLLHAIFNVVIIAVSWEEAWAVLTEPQAKGFDPAGWWGIHPQSLYGAIAIGAFHAHHFAFYTTTTEDIVHHFVNAGAVVLIGAMCPWGRFTALSNLAMCGVPGGANYFALWLHKLKLLSRMRQKRFNRFLNICVRYPIQLLSHYLVALSVYAGRAPEVSWVVCALMFFGSCANSANALYYGDAVVGNFHIEMQREQERRRQDKLKRRLERASNGNTPTNRSTNDLAAMDDPSVASPPQSSVKASASLPPPPSQAAYAPAQRVPHRRRIRMPS